MLASGQAGPAAAARRAASGTGCTLLSTCSSAAGLRLVLAVFLVLFVVGTATLAWAQGT